MKKKKKEKLYFTFLIVLVFIIIGTIFITYNKKLENEEMLNELNKIETIKVEKKKEKNYKKKYENLRNQYNNKEIIGILTIKEINLDTVLVQTDNNDYYMNHLPNRKKARVGSTFIDYRTNIYSSKRVNIYGHNSSKVETDFKKLEKLLEKNTFNKTQKLYIETENGLKEYEIFLVKIITKDDEHTKVEFLNTKEYINHIDKLKENSLYIRDIKITGNDQVLILQTCLLNNTLGDYLIIGAKGGLGK